MRLDSVHFQIKVPSWGSFDCHAISPSLSPIPKAKFKGFQELGQEVKDRWRLWNWLQWMGHTWALALALTCAQTLARTGAPTRACIGRERERPTFSDGHMAGRHSTNKLVMFLVVRQYYSFILGNVFGWYKRKLCISFKYVLNINLIIISKIYIFQNTF